MEASLDSKLLVLSADISSNKARKLQLQHQLFDTELFLSKLKPNGGEIDWSKAAQIAQMHTKNINGISTM